MDVSKIKLGEETYNIKDASISAWARAATKPTYIASEVGALPSTTTIPTKTSDLTNDSGFIDKALYYGTCITAAAAMPKICTVETFPTFIDNGVTHAKDGTIIAVKFTYSDTNATDAPTLNVNGIGAKSIMYSNTIITSTVKNTTVAGTAKMLAYYRYDTSLDDGNGAWEYLGKSVDSNSTYSNTSLGQGYAVQSNSSAATAITATLSSYALSTGGIVAVKFTYDVPTNATLNVNDKGAKAIYYKNAAIESGVIKAGDTATFIYSTYYHLISIDNDPQEKAGYKEYASYQDMESDNPSNGTIGYDQANEVFYLYDENNGYWRKIENDAVVSTITSGSTNAVQGGAIYTALAGKADFKWYGSFSAMTAANPTNGTIGYDGSDEHFYIYDYPNGKWKPLDQFMQRVVINMGENNHDLIFTDADNNPLTHYQVKDLLNNPNIYPILKYNNIKMMYRFDSSYEDYWEFERRELFTSQYVCLTWDGVSEIIIDDEGNSNLNNSFMATTHPANAITSAKITEWNGKEDKQIERLRFVYTPNTGVITFTDVDGNSLTHSEVRALLNNHSKEVRLFDEDSDTTLFDMSVDSGWGNTDGWDFTSLGGYVVRFISLVWESNSIVVANSGETDLVLTSRTINGKALSSNITLTASDVDALPSNTTIPTVPTNVSSFTNDAGYLTSHQDISEKADKVTVVEISTTGAVSQALDANKFYKFTGALTSLTLTLNASTGFVMYAGKFITGSGWGSNGLSIPATVTEATNNDEIEAGKTYEFSIVDNVIVIKEV